MRLPGTDCKLSIEYYNDILTTIQNENKQCVIGTDQNMDLLDVNFQYARQLLDNFYAVGMLPVVTRSTRVTHSSATLIDNLYVKYNQLEHVHSGILTSTEGELTLWWRFDDELWTRFVYVVLSVFFYHG